MSQTKKTTELEQKLTVLLNKRTYTCTKRACTGKYRGLYDYGLAFNDGSHIFISCGRRYYEQRLHEYVEQYTYYRTHHDWLEGQLRKVIARDNQQAVRLGLAPISLLRLELIEEASSAYTFWPRMVLEQNDQKFSQLETMFKYACLGHQPAEYFTEKQNRPDKDLGRLHELEHDDFIAIILGFLYGRRELESRYF